MPRALAPTLALVALGGWTHAQPPPPAACTGLTRPDRDGHFVAREDLAGPRSPADGDDWLALVNRSPRGVLAASYAPRDLVDLRTMARALPAACSPPDRQCLRREAAIALRALAAALRAQTREVLVVHSAFRRHRIQCEVFHRWLRRAGNFCPAVVANALPGHSQHQLGTAADVFSASWLRGGYRFRDGFGCSVAGRWLAEHAWTFGFVIPYPLHPDHRAPASDCQARPEASEQIDPRTGYKHEPWHLRYIGRDPAARFRAAWAASGVGTATEITLEQWIRRERGRDDAVDPPVCDGCNCGACATFHPPDATTPAPCPPGPGVRYLDPATDDPAATAR